MNLLSKTRSTCGVVMQLFIRTLVTEPNAGVKTAVCTTETHGTRSQIRHDDGDDDDDDDPALTFIYTFNCLTVTSKYETGTLIKLQNS